MKPEKKTLNTVQKYIKERRMRFLSLFPNDTALFVNMLASYSQDLFWKDGELVDSQRACYTAEDKIQLTEAGWTSFENGNDTLHNWQEPARGNCLLEIPDDAAKHWLDFLSHQAFVINRYKPEEMKTFIFAYYQLQSMGQQYKDDYAKRSWEGFQQVQEACKYIWERVNFIQRAEWEKKHPRPLQVKKGTTVRLKTGYQTAVVEVDNLTFGNHKVEGACYLSEPLGGTRYWNKDDLIAVEPKQKS